MRDTDKTALGKSGTTVARCSCNSAYQDAVYGPGMRVHNLKANISTGRATCTVCGRRK